MYYLYVLKYIYILYIYIFIRAVRVFDVGTRAHIRVDVIIGRKWISGWLWKLIVENLNF
jgi:hypothetical protein